MKSKSSSRCIAARTRRHRCWTQTIAAGKCVVPSLRHRWRDANCKRGRVIIPRMAHRTRPLPARMIARFTFGFAVGRSLALCTLTIGLAACTPSREPVPAAPAPEAAAAAVTRRALPETAPSPGTSAPQASTVAPGASRACRHLPSSFRPARSMSACPSRGARLGRPPSSTTGKRMRCAGSIPRWGRANTSATRAGAAADASTPRMAPKSPWRPSPSTIGECGACSSRRTSVRRHALSAGALIPPDSGSESAAPRCRRASDRRARTARRRCSLPAGPCWSHR